MNASMTQKVWLITGCSSGFGRALAEAALERGDKVVATARNSTALLELAARWPGTAHAAELDVTDPARCEAVVAETLQVFGRLDVLVNNAGYGLVGSLEECNPEQVQRNFAVNFFGPLSLMRAASSNSAAGSFSDGFHRAWPQARAVDPTRVRGHFRQIRKVPERDGWKTTR